MNKFNDAFTALYKGNNLMRITELRYLPRWLVVVIDVFICVISLFLTYLILSKTNIFSTTDLPSLGKYAAVVGINILGMFCFKTYAGIIRHSTFFDLFKILLSSGFTAFALLILNYSLNGFFNVKFVPTPFIIVYFLLSVTIFFLFRMIVKQVFHLFMEFRRSVRKKRVLVVGIEDATVAIGRVLLDNPHLPYQLVGFITKRSDSKKAILLGKRILSQEEFFSSPNLINDVDAILIVKEIMSKTELEEWMNLALDAGLQVLKSPSVSKIRDNDLMNDIKSLQIEDLLNRKPIKIESNEVKSRHFENAVLVTGGAGSIGSEIVRQVAQFLPSLIVVLDQAETPLYEIELEMLEKFPEQNFVFALGDISNKARVESLFEKYNFSMVYHAAAYKHVPLVEDNPHEAIFVNLKGTRNIALLSKKYKVNRFVMISTDKAVNPTNVMGASKRASELFVQALQKTSDNTTKFITTRFGNVLGSNGSVIPHFKKQIEKGGPLTITHPDIIRYFMTIPEACELVLQAGTMGNGGEIYVFDMGEPVKILDLARRMIRLSGFTPDVDIKIIFTGLRPGEKLYEELLSDDTRTMPTHNEKIMISRDNTVEFEEIDQKFEIIIKAAVEENNFEVVKLLKCMVPEFKSKNSNYEILDKTHG